MVNLTSEQESRLAEVRNAYAAYRTFDEQVALLREQYKGPIRAAITAAEDAGVPEKRLYSALEFSQVAPYRNFIRAPRNAGVYLPGVPMAPLPGVTAAQAPSEPDHGEFAVRVKRTHEAALTVWDTFGIERLAATPDQNNKPGKQDVNIAGPAPVDAKYIDDALIDYLLEENPDITPVINWY